MRIDEHLATLARRIRFHLQRDRFDRELREEMDFHLELQAAENRRAGMTDVEARGAARRRFGNPTSQQERAVAIMSVPWLESLLQDLRYAARSLRRSPGFAVVAVLSLALGVGATTAVFTVADRALRGSTAFAGADRLVVPFPTTTPGIMSAVDTFPWSVVRAGEIRASVPAFDRLAMFDWDDFVLSGADGSERLRVETVSGDYFDLLGVRAVAGRVLVPADDAPGTASLVISESLWRRRFGGASDAVGRSVTLQNEEFTIVGVAPASFRGLLGGADAWVPMQALARFGGGMARRLTEPDMSGARVVARLRPDATTALASAQVAEAVRRSYEARPVDFERLAGSRWSGGVVSLAEARRHPMVPSLLLVLAATSGAVLLLVCANVASLLLARARTREQEMGVRAALGAARSRLVRQLCTESVLLALAGAAAGLVAAVGFTRALVAARPTLPPAFILLRMADPLEGASLVPDARVLLFTLGVTIMVAILVGVLPAFAAGRADVAHALSSRGAGSGARRSRARSALVVAEVALATVLLVGATTMVGTMRGLLRIDPGFVADDVVRMRIDRSLSANREPASWSVLADRVRALPGVESAGLHSCTPLGTDCRMAPVLRVAGLQVSPADYPPLELHAMDEGYLEALRVGLVDGRVLTRRDVDEGGHRALLNERAARLLFGAQSPLGRRVAYRPDDSVGVEIVGIVRDVKYGALEEDAAPAAYVPLGSFAGGTESSLFVRAPGGADIVPAVRRAIAEVDPAAAVHDVRTMDAVLRAATANRRFVAGLLLGFAGVAGFLAALGVYGVLSYTVASRAREYGVRIAVGAAPSTVRGLVVRGGLALTGAGIAAGSVLAVAAGGLLRHFLYGSDSHGVIAFGAAAALVGAAGLLAAWIPARRATLVDPIVVLRGE